MKWYETRIVNDPKRYTEYVCVLRKLQCFLDRNEQYALIYLNVYKNTNHMATWSVKVMNFIDCFKQIFQECIVKSGSFVLYPAYFYS